MSPSSLPRTPRALRPWLAAAMMLTVWLTATPARCDPGPVASRLAATARANPAWPWLQVLWTRLPWGAGSGQQLHAAGVPHPRANGRHGPGTAGSSAVSGTVGGGSGNGSGGSTCNTDPNGCHPGT
jgi:hypothetical protein